jgi:ABC-type polysaccharide/polyol phosphate transport system ATPase subunit
VTAPFHYDDDLDEPLLTIEGLSKSYPPPGRGRMRNLFSRLGGIPPDGVLFGGSEFADDDEDDLDDDDSDEAPPTLGEAPAALDNVNLTAWGGSCIALVGPAGAGKSLLMRILAGMVPPTAGRVVLRGLVAPALDSVTSATPKDRAVKSGLPMLAGMVRVPPPLVRHHLPAILEFLESPELRRAHPGNIDGRRRGEIVLATMLEVDPDILLFDTRLPPGPGARRYVERFHDLRDRGALIIAAARELSPQLDQLDGLVDRVVTLNAGTIVSDQPYSEAAES